MQPIPEWLVPGMHTPLESKSWLVEEGGTVPILVTKPWVRETCLKFGIEFRTIALGVSDPEREQRPLGGVRRLRENRCARRGEDPGQEAGGVVPSRACSQAAGLRPLHASHTCTWAGGVLHFFRRY